MRRADEDARRDAYMLEAELRSKDKNGAGELDAYARGLAAFPDDPDILYARALALGAPRRYRRAPKPISARSWSPIPTAPQR